METTAAAQIAITASSALIAAVVAIIGFQQYRIAAARLRLDLFEKRYAVYKATQYFLSRVLENGTTTYKECFEFRRDSQDALFLFGPGIDEYVEAIYKKGVALRASQNKFESLPAGPDRDAAVDKNEEHLTKLIDELNLLRAEFEPYLGFKHWK